MVNNWLQCLHYSIFPSYCILCDSPGLTTMDICQDCLHDLPLNHRACYQCSLPLTSGNLCGDCLKHPPAFDFSYTPFLYQDAIRDLLLGLKFNDQLKNARLLAQLFAQEAIRHQQTMPECILPVPLHPSRMRERGFNQALLLSRYLAKQLHIPLTQRLCSRIKQTQAQSNLKKKTERIKNLRGAFQVNQTIEAQHIAIVDDVLTTGTTVNELAKTLKKAGVETVSIWCIGRAI